MRQLERHGILAVSGLLVWVKKMYSYYQILWLFLLYSILGWIVEVAFVTLTTGRLVNRGFLNGPVCPIYGFGMVGVLLILGPVSGQLLWLFLGGMALCTAVECFGGWVLDRLFHMRWWDYTDKPFNFRGYVCLGYSVMWGIGVVLVMRVVHPLIFGLVTSVPQKIGVVPLVIIYAVYAIDFVVSLKTVIGISRNLGEMEKVANALHQLGNEMSQMVGNAVLDTTEKLSEEREALEERSERFVENSRERITKSVTELNERRAELQRRIAEMEQRSRALQQNISRNARILRAFPGLRRDASDIRLTEELKKLKDNGKGDGDDLPE